MHRRRLITLVALTALLAMITPAALGSTAAQSSGSGGVSQSPTLSVTDRLADRREVAAGTRAYSIGFEDGRFYANGWHITGEMGGVWTPPLKLVDGVWFGLDGQWVGPATKFTSGWGYTRFDLPDTAGLKLQRTDFVPDGRRGAQVVALGEGRLGRAVEPLLGAGDLPLEHPRALGVGGHPLAEPVLGEELVRAVGGEPPRVRLDVDVLTRPKGTVRRRDREVGHGTLQSGDGDGFT